MRKQYLILFMRSRNYCWLLCRLTFILSVTTIADNIVLHHPFVPALCYFQLSSQLSSQILKFIHFAKVFLNVSLRRTAIIINYLTLSDWLIDTELYKNFGWIQLLLFKSFSSRLSRFYWLVIYHDRNRSNVSTTKYWRKLLVIGDKYFWVIRQKMFQNSFESFKSLSKLFQWTQCAIYSALRITIIEKPKAGHLMT